MNGHAHRRSADGSGAANAAESIGRTRGGSHVMGRFRAGYPGSHARRMLPCRHLSSQPLLLCFRAAAIRILDPEPPALQPNLNVSGRAPSRTFRTSRVRLAPASRSMRAALGPPVPLLGRSATGEPFSYPRAMSGKRCWGPLTLVLAVFSDGKIFRGQLRAASSRR